MKRHMKPGCKARCKGCQYQLIKIRNGKKSKFCKCDDLEKLRKAMSYEAVKALGHSEVPGEATKASESNPRASRAKRK